MLLRLLQMLLDDAGLVAAAAAVVADAEQVVQKVLLALLLRLQASHLQRAMEAQAARLVLHWSCCSPTLELQQACVEETVACPILKHKSYDRMDPSLQLVHAVLHPCLYYADELRQVLHAAGLHQVFHPSLYEAELHQALPHQKNDSMTGTRPLCSPALQLISEPVRASEPSQVRHKFEKKVPFKYKRGQLKCKATSRSVNMLTSDER